MSTQQQQQQSGVSTTQQNATVAAPSTPHTTALQQQNTTTSSNTPSKYNQLLAVIDEMGKDVKPCYTGNKMSAERLKRAIIHARILVRECLIETERSSRM